MKKAGKQGSSLASTLKDGVGGAATFVANKVSASTIALGNLMADAVKATAGAAKNLVQDVFEEYANTEQLYGGVETIFKDSADLVKKNASEAFMTAGMSANEYMQTVTSFSSSLLQGLDGDTKKAAEVADMAIRDMSDNANKFGTDMGLIQNAYQGFAKDNFTMLDNLKLGYGGTQAEMARLINDSGVLGKKIVTAANVSEVPLDKMFEAIHIIQQEMNITGTTAAEAADTISGSFAAFKATWRNLLSGLADEKDVDQLVDNLFESGENLLGNIARLVPRIGENTVKAFDAFLENFDFYKKLKGAYKDDGIAGVVGTIKTDLKKELEKLGPIAIDTGADILAGIYTGLTGNTTSREQIKAFFSGLWQDVIESKNAFVAQMQEISADFSAGFNAEPGTEKEVQSLIYQLGGQSSSIVEEIRAFMSGLQSGLFSGFTENVSSDDFTEFFNSAFDAGYTALTEYKTALRSVVNTLFESLTGQELTTYNIGEMLGSALGAGMTAGVEVLKIGTSFFSDLSDVLGDNSPAADKVAGVFEAGVTAAKDLLVVAKEFGFDLYAALNESGAAVAEKEFDDNVERFEAFGQRVKEIVSKAWDGAKTFVESNIEPMFEDKAEDLMSSPVYDPVSDFVKSAAESVKGFWNDFAAEGQKIKEGTSAQWYMMKYSPEEVQAALDAIKNSSGNGEEAVITKEAQVENYGAVVDAVMDAWVGKYVDDDTGGGMRFEVEESFAPAAEALTQAANAITAAASAPAPVNVEVNASIDGQQVAAIVTPTVSRGINRAIMQARFA